jgi:predicted secreted Zn-dependent protease
VRGAAEKSPRLLDAFGESSERAKLLVEQLELAIEDLEEAQGAEEAKADLAACASSRSFTNHTRNEIQHDRVEGRRPLKRREMTDLRQYL